MTFGEKILETAEEGIVLLRNRNNALPFGKNDNVAVFGRCQIDFYKCGLGSGGSVHAPYVTNLVDNLPCADKLLAGKYHEWVSENPFDNGGGVWAGEPYNQKEMPLSEDEVKTLSERNNKAVFVVGRNAGEDKDMAAEKGSWFLKDDEASYVEMICRYFDDVVIIFNTCGIVDTSWIDDKRYGNRIKAVVYAWQGGQEAGRACANVLLGKNVPSGKLVDTIPFSFSDNPSTEGFGAPGECYYTEDIYVGYRFYSTFANDKVMFPFGFGLSYTTFEISEVHAESSGMDVTVSCTVKNTGDTYNGKEVVQIYASCPQGKLGKPARELVGFAKTKLLSPGESETLKINFSLIQLKSYDDSGLTGHKNCFVLEDGKYSAYCGNDAMTAEKIDIDGADGIVLEKTLVIEELEQALAPNVPFKRIRPGILLPNGNYSLDTEDVPLNEIDLTRRIKENLPEDIAYTGDKGIRFSDIKKDKSKIDDFIAQLDDAALMTLVRGEGMMSQKATPGIASVFGGVSKALHDYGIPVAGCSDGPSGIRLDTGDEANLMPVGTMIACTWNLSLTEELFEFEGKELFEHKIDTLLAPGINIHRNPLNGRNFEYFSEDPFLTGKFAVAELNGVHKSGVYPTIKHFAANSQETDRRNHNSIVSERALREIYLPAFKTAIFEGKAKSIMTAYNRINGILASSNYDLANTILRKEWGFTGLTMTDWWTMLNDCVRGGKGGMTKVSSMVKSRGSVYMITENDAACKGGNDDDLESSLKSGWITRGELQACARDIILYLASTLVSNRPLMSLDNTNSFEPVMEIPEGVVFASENMRFMKNGKTREYFFAPEDGLYNVLGCYSKPGDSTTVSQSVTNVLVDGRNAIAFNCRTTEGKPFFVNVGLIKLKKGYYEISLEHTKPGIDFAYIGFSRSISISSGISRLE